MSSPKSLGLAVLILSFVVLGIFIEPARAQQTVDVTISNLAFNPQNITIRVGSAITWTNNDSVIHTLWFVKPEDGTTYTIAGEDGLSDPILPGNSWSQTFNEVVTLQYYSFGRLWITGFIRVVLSAYPVSSFAYQPTEPIVNQTVTFDASQSYDPDGRIVYYNWNFGDGTTLGVTNPFVTHTYKKDGTYDVTLVVTDDSGLISSTRKTVAITAKDVTRPIAEAGSDQTVDEDTTVTFDGSGSTDNVGIVKYLWTFTDATPKTLADVAPTYNFATPGTYIVTLNVTDAAGNWDVDTLVITVLDVTNPIAEAGIDQIAVEDTTVNFDARNSTDNVGIAKYEWNFGDGTNGTGLTTSHIYTDPGKYTVTLTVTDARGNYDTDSIIITVLIDTDGDGIPDITDPDKDGDGIPNAWEEENGLNPLDPADASRDNDGDGLTNLQEYQGGTDPNSYFSPFPMWIIGVVAVAIAAIAVLVYRTRARRRSYPTG